MLLASSSQGFAARCCRASPVIWRALSQPRYRRINSSKLGVACRAQRGFHCVVAFADYQHYRQSGTTAQRKYSTGDSLSNTVYLRNLQNGAEIYLVGTAHISEKSAEEVKETIHKVKPSTVFVELCDRRAKAFREEGHSGSKPLDVLQAVLNQRLNIPSALFQIGVQALYKILSFVGFKPGQEFKVAMQEADKIGAKVVHGDRSVEKTMTRISEALTFQDVLHMFTAQPSTGGPTFADFDIWSGGTAFIEKMKSRENVRKMKQAMEEANPKLMKVLLHERDIYMAKKLAKLEGTVVGVVGMAHLDGIEEYWQKQQSNSH